MPVARSPFAFAEGTGQSPGRGGRSAFQALPRLRWSAEQAHLRPPGSSGYASSDRIPVDFMPSKPPNLSSRTQQGFTLIELLVVIAIISILATMLVPAIGMVRAAANASRCLNSQRQVALGCVAYSIEQDGLLPALYLTTTPITIFWSNLILENYLEARRDTDNSHTNFAGTVLQGCTEWNNGRVKGSNPNWEGAYGMNGYPFCDNGTFDARSSNYVGGAANAQGIALSQITKPSNRLFFADALNNSGAFAGQSTYVVNAITGVTTETSNSTNLKSWHTVGKLVTITMFDGHGEKRSVTTAASAIISP
jgi:prepilin-type N-terminal cleavage/methylation domain-containing protein